MPEISEEQATEQVSTVRVRELVLLEPVVAVTAALHKATIPAGTKFVFAEDVQ